MTARDFAIVGSRAVTDRPYSPLVLAARRLEDLFAVAKNQAGCFAGGVSNEFNFSIERLKEEFGLRLRVKLLFRIIRGIGHQETILESHDNLDAGSELIGTRMPEYYFIR